jgi:hypothetical protein
LIQVSHSLLGLQSYGIYPKKRTLSCKNVIFYISSLFVDEGQRKGLFAHTVHKKPLQGRKNAVTLHRRKEQKPADKDNTTHYY